MKTLAADIPTELREKLQEIVCWSCDGAKGGGEPCEWRSHGEFCEVVEPTVERIHETYWEYQQKELRK